MKRGAELLALTKTSKSDKDVCKLPGLNKILVPRVSGTQDNIVVRNVSVFYLCFCNVIIRGFNFVTIAIVCKNFVHIR